jgi:surface carbohydrate biosynthesis protein
LSADYYFSFGTNIREFIKKYINVEVIPIGSFKSNLIKQKSSNTVKNNKLKILYVSSFRLRNKNQIFEKRSDGKVIYWQDIFNNDMKLCKLVNNYCINTNNNFTILGTTKNNHNLEIKYFKKKK